VLKVGGFTVGPQEYGIERAEKEEIGVLTSLPLLRKILDDLKGETMTDQASAFFYLTKESHIQTLVNLVIFSDLQIVMPKLPGLSYFCAFYGGSGRVQPDQLFMQNSIIWCVCLSRTVSRLVVMRKY
jgi:hypothetical protein